jgi:uncharacterized protein (TIGR03086 family)
MTPQHRSDQTILHRAHNEFVRVASTMTDEQRQRPTPCADWTGDDVIRHVVAGAVMTAALLGGTDGRSSIQIRETWTNGRAVTSRFLTAIALERAAFQIVEPQEAVDHPAFAMSANDLLGQRIIEYAVHTWDLRQAIGDPTPLDAEIAQRAWQLAEPLAPIAAHLGVFGDGPSGLLPHDAHDALDGLEATDLTADDTTSPHRTATSPHITDEDRLVDLTGRRVASQHPHPLLNETA